jgi:hypothetical protein
VLAGIYFGIVAEYAKFKMHKTVGCYYPTFYWCETWSLNAGQEIRELRGEDSEENGLKRRGNIRSLIICV